MRIKRRKKYFVFLCLLVMSIIVGYALISSNLTINGLGIFAKNNWDVSLTKITTKNSNVTETTPATITPDGKKVEFNINLTEPGSFYEFNLEVSNTGSLDAMLDTWNVEGLTDAQKEFISIEIKYDDSVELNKYDLLNKDSKEYIKVIIKYRDDITAENLPSGDSSISASFDISYIIADENAKERERLDDVENYLRANTSNVFLNTTIEKTKIESITTLKNKNVPSDALGSFDVSNAENGSIMLYYYDNDNNGLYEVYIGQQGGVKANPACNSMFASMTALTNIDLSNFYTSRVTNMSYMFEGSSKLKIIDLSTFDTTNVTNMSWMFFGCSEAEVINVSSFYTPKLKSMDKMFTFCKKVKELDVSHFDTSNVTSFSASFSTCQSLTSIDLRNFDTRKITDFGYMFKDDIALQNVDLSGEFFDATAANGNFPEMFIRCSALQNVYVKDENQIALYRDYYGDFATTPFKVKA